MSSYYIGNYNLSDNSKTSFYIEENNEEELNIQSSFNYNIYRKFTKNESVSPGTQTFIYLNKKEIAISVRKKPLDFKHLVNNPIISKYFI